MNRNYADTIVNNYIKRIYSYVSQRVSCEQDVCDLAQDICFQIYKSALVKEFYAEDAFVWKVAKHALANYYRKKQKTYFTISLEDADLDFEDGNGGLEHHLIAQENYLKIRQEIAYLSKMQRRIIIMFYYEEKKQSEIADILNIPLGTVKWHLKEARKELKKGMETMRNRKDLKFNPIEFDKVALCGSDGDIGAAINFFRSALSQNIIYCIYQQELTIEEIADALGVSPIYIESELEFLEEYSLVIKKKNRYISNILIEEATEESCQKHKHIYETAAAAIANRLFDEIISGGYLNSEDIYGPENDRNFIMWSLIFYLLAWAESDDLKKKITFDEVAELRADGGKNIITASVKTPAGEKYQQETHLAQLCGPCWNESNGIMLWLIDADWTEKRVKPHYGGPNIERDLKLLNRFAKGESLSEDDYAFMCQNHYIKKTANGFALNIVVLKEGNVKQQLFTLTKQIKNDVLHEIETELTAYKAWVLEYEHLPVHLKKQREFGLQHMFHSDGWFMLYAKKALVESGRLKLVDREQKFNVTEMMILSNN